MRKITFGLLLVMVCALVACKSNKLKVDVSGIDLDIKIERFEKQLFELNKGSLLSDLVKKQPRILALFSEKVIGLGKIDSQNYSQHLNKFLKDSIMNLVVNKVDSVFPNLDVQEEELESGFKHLKYYYPKVEIPRVFSQISGFNQSVVVDKGLIGISLDKYLGKDCEFYALLGRPVYVRKNMAPNRIAQDILLAYALTEFPFKAKKDNLMEQMIYQGKILYFLQALLPEKDENDIMKYSGDDFKWCVTNESRVWAYIIEHKHLFSTESSMTRNYINDAPFTSGMPQESPGRIGTWIGLQIVKSYMEKHDEVSLPDLMLNDDYASLLRDSAYEA